MLKLGNVLIIILLSILLVVAGAALWMLSNHGTIYYADYVSNEEYANLIGGQFHKNMRYENSSISFYFSDSCSENKKDSARKAFEFLSEQTILEFYERDNGEINIACSDVSPPSDNKNHFVAGEGGPYLVVNASAFNIIKSGKISLYKDEKCDTPNIAIHEIIHALGFDHVGNKSDIMYPVSDCDQEVSNELVEELDKIYSIDSLPDLVLSSVSVNASSNYLSFNVTISNEGIRDANKVVLILRTKDKTIRSFELNELEVGSRKVLTVNNVWAFPSPKEIEFYVDYYGNELSKDNNLAVIKIEK